MPIELTPEILTIFALTMLAGWIINTWIRVRHGYPLQGAWGQSVYPKGDEAGERVKLITKENAELRAEVSAVKERLANVERIVTDSGYHLTGEIERLRDEAGSVQ